MKLNKDFQQSTSFPKDGFKKTADYYTAFTKYVVDTNAMWENDIKDGDTLNPNHAPPMAVLAENYEAVKGTNLFIDVLEPMAMKEFSLQRIATAGLVAQKSGLISMEEIASDMQVIISAAMAYNRDTKLPSRYGVKPQTTYNVRDADYSDLSLTTPLIALGAGTAAAASGGLLIPALIGGAGLAAVTGIDLLTTTPLEIRDMAKEVNIMFMLNRMKVAGIGSSAEGDK